jgi:type IV secretory pathway TrbL component
VGLDTPQGNRKWIFIGRDKNIRAGSHPDLSSVSVQICLAAGAGDIAPAAAAAAATARLGATTSGFEAPIETASQIGRRQSDDQSDQDSLHALFLLRPA